jgi:two-component system, response regulator
MTAADEISVLLVEDNPDDAEFTLRALRKANVALNIVLVDNGVKALDFVFGTGSYADRAGAKLPRVMLLDLKMPKVDGLEVARRIKNDPRTRALPIVIFTSSREQRDITESYLLGANSYVVKPIDYAELITKLGDLVRYWLQLNESPVA